MGSGLIYLIIVGMWISYFLPRWVSNHEEVSGKSVERFKNSMAAVAHSSGVPTEVELALENEHQLLMRRISFTSLSTLLIISGILAVFKLLSPIAILLPISGLILFVVHVRRQISALNHVARTQRIISNNSDSPSSTNYAELINNSKITVERRIQDTSKYEISDQWIPLADRVEKISQELSGITLLPKGSSQTRETWEPQNVPLPTYVSAPKAITPKRIIDLTIPGAWSEEQEKLRAVLDAVAPTRDQIFDQELADQAAEALRANRAANE